MKKGNNEQHAFWKDINGDKQKIGRNAPCPCGSGKKYKNVVAAIKTK